MKITDTDQIVKITDFENFLNIYEDNKGMYRYNLNETLYIDPSNIAKEYVVTHSMFWTTISYMIYETTHLAWLLMKVNNVGAKDIFKAVEAGNKIIYIPKEYVNDILRTFK